MSICKGLSSNPEFLAASPGEVLYSRSTIVRSRIPNRRNTRQGTKPWQIVFLVLGRSRLEESKRKLLTKQLLAWRWCWEAAGICGFCTAAIVCSGNVCWHTHERYEYLVRVGVVVHEDDWNGGPMKNLCSARDEGRGYWRGDTWTSW